MLHRFYTELSIINSHVISLYLQKSQKSRVINILFCIFSCTAQCFENSYQCCYWGLLTKTGRNRKSQKSTFCWTLTLLAYESLYFFLIILSVFKQPVIPLRWFFPFDLCWHRLILIHFFLLISFSAMSSAIDQHNSCHNHQATCQKFWHRKSDFRKNKLIRSKPLNPYTSCPISKQVHEKKFTFIFLMLPIQKQYDKKSGTPSWLV